MNEFVLIEYSNSVDMAGIVYHNTFSNRLYIDADVSKPEYVIDEDGVEDADGEFDPTLQKWAKKYSITFYAQEFLIDALSLMTLHDQIYVTLKNGESSQVLDAEMSDPSWDSDIECWAEVVITFTTDYIIKRACDGNMQQGCIAPVISVAGAYDASAGGGQAWWEGTTSPPPASGASSFFYMTFANGTYLGNDDVAVGFYIRSDGVWNLVEMSDNQFGEIVGETDCVYVVKSGLSYGKAPYIWDVDDETGGDASVFAVTNGIENMFFQVQYDDGGGWADVGDPALASAFQAPDGYIVTTGAGVGIDFRLLWYTHSCEYGTGNEVTQTIT